MTKTLPGTADFAISPPQATDNFGRFKGSFFLVPDGAPSGRLVARPISPAAIAFMAAETQAEQQAVIGGAAAVHTHAIADVTGLQTALNAKADASALATTNGNVASNTSAISTNTANIATNTSNISALTTTVSGKANTVHTHVAADITNFNGAVDARIPAQAVTSVNGRTGAVITQSTDITDATTIGKSMLTAANAAAERTLLGIGTAALQNNGDAALTPAFTGDVTNTGIGNTVLTVGTGKITNNQLAGSIADNKISSSSYWNGKQDALTAGANISIASNVVATTNKYYLGTTLKNNVKTYSASATVAAGVATFYLTSDGTNSGTALFSNVYQASLNWWVNSTAGQYQVGSYAFDGKKLTLNVSVASSVLLGLLQFTAAANGTVLYLRVDGD